jgi:hypothetical protein
MLHARLCLGICCLLVPTIVGAQLARGDSLRLLSEARSAQARFERIRRAYSPAADDAGGEACELEIGRMCYWNENGKEKAPPEYRTITQARIALIARLGYLNTLSPHDGWIAGEHVRYMVQAGDDSGAVSAARLCTPRGWYCGVLLGYALHESERYGDAVTTFDSALAQMPDSERCRWNDISVLLDDAERDVYERIPCGQRDSVERHFWALAQPSFAVAGNDRRTEHYARVLLADLSQDAANVYGLTWGQDLRELLIRYGDPLWYSAPWAEPFSGPPTPIGHDRVPSFHFVADMDDGRPHWDAYSRRARERYAPPYLDTLTKLDAQFAMMKRGDSALVIAVYADTASGTAVLGVSSGVSDSAQPNSRGARIRRARTAWKPVMVAMEDFDAKRRIDARARHWLAPPRHVAGAPDLSTLLLFDPDASGAGVETLDDALAHALTTDDLRGTRRLGLYWEVYGRIPDSTSARDRSGNRVDSSSVVANDSLLVARDDSSVVLVTVVRTDGGVMRWLGSALHITRRDAPLAVRWHDARPASGIAAHSVVLDLAQLPEGVYRVTVAAGADNAHRTEISREIRLR